MLVGGQCIWDDDTNSLYYVDQFSGSFLRYSVDDDAVYTATVTGQTGLSGFLAPIQGQRNRFLASLNDQVFVMKWDGVSTTATKEKTVFTVKPTFNVDGVYVSPTNDIFVGGFNSNFCQSPANLSLNQYTRDKELIQPASGFTTTVGIVLNEKLNILYQLDPCGRTLYGYNYNPWTGRICKFNFAIFRWNNCLTMLFLA